MFDFSKLGDMTKLAAQAKQMQSQQELVQREQIKALQTIATKLDEVIRLLKEQNKQSGCKI